MPPAGKIRVLPEKIVNKIAAGEVVERPASVVKELVENSLDAGAKNIRIEAEAGGRKLIRVSDDGSGMSPDDALLAIERHATSKIEKDEDLFSIRTLGFRGEALPSISAVSHFELLTRLKDADAGVRVRVDGGTLQAVEPAGCAPGTTVTVRNLFFNVPARLKFLRSHSTELGHISDVVARIALGNPSVHFQFFHENREMLEAPASQDIASRISVALGASVFESMREMKEYFEGERKIYGYVSLPELHRSSPSFLYIYVNGRFVRDRFINHAIMEAYRSFLPKGRFPVAVIFIELSPSEVDVNVHPTKAEVRFREPGWIHEAIKKSVLKAFERKSVFSEIPKQMGTTSTQVGGGKKESDSARTEEIRSALKRSVEKWNSTTTPLKPFQQDKKEMRPERGVEKAHCEPPPLPSPSRLRAVSRPPQGDYFQSMEILGQLRNTYLVCQSNEGLTLIDQHAAHERIAFERLKKDWRNRSIQKQALLFPETLELSIKEAKEMERVLEMMNSLGFEIEPFGEKAFITRALPAVLAKADPRAIVLDLLDALSDIGSAYTLEDRLDEVFARISCHAVIRAGKSLSDEEMGALLRSLDEADYPLTCPHGRPICVHITYEELEKMFGRR